MKPRKLLDKPAPQLRTLAAGEHHTLYGWPGTVVQVLGGRVWITQEGDRRDYVVPEHADFASAGEGMLVVSALADATRIAIYRVATEPAAEWMRSAVRLEPGFFEALQRNARRESALLFADGLRALWRILCRWWTRRMPPSVAVRPHRGYHC